MIQRRYYKEGERERGKLLYYWVFFCIMSSEISCEMRDRAYRICRDYLHGAWRLITPREMVIKQIRWVCVNVYLCVCVPVGGCGLPVCYLWVGGCVCVCVCVVVCECVRTCGCVCVWKMIMMIMIIIIIIIIMIIMIMINTTNSKE